MTRKDFELIASALMRSRPERDTEKYVQWLYDTSEIGSDLKKAHVRFDEDRFYNACMGEK